jgi:uncharacterized membrane protein YhaH (DUF805 family)
MYENSFTFTKMLAAYKRPHRFDGRSTRTELLGYLVVSWVLATATNWLVMAMGVAGGSIDLGIASLSIAYLVWWLPFPALAVRRFHDQDRSGLWAIPLILPTVLVWLGQEHLTRGKPIGYAIAAIYLVALVLLFWRPTEGMNSYGPDPRLDPEDWEESSTE